MDETHMVSYKHSNTRVFQKVDMEKDTHEYIAL